MAIKKSSVFVIMGLLLLFTCRLSALCAQKDDPEFKKWQAACKRLPPVANAIQLKMIGSFPAENSDDPIVPCLPISFIHDNKGDWYLSDQKQNCILVYDEHGRYLREIGRPGGQGPGDLSGPFRIREFRDQIIVWEANNGRFSVFEKNGKYIRSIKYFKTFMDFDVDSRGRLFVACMPNGRGEKLIDVLDGNGVVLYSFGDDHPDGSPRSFLHIAIGDRDVVYLAFDLKPLVQKYSEAGELLAQFTIKDNKIIDYAEKTNRDFLKKREKNKHMPIFYDLIVGKGAFFLLLRGPYVEILKYDWAGKLLDTFVLYQYGNFPMGMAMSDDGNEHTFHLICPFEGAVNHYKVNKKRGIKNEE